MGLNNETRSSTVHIKPISMVSFLENTLTNDASMIKIVSNYYLIRRSTWLDQAKICRQNNEGR